MEELTIRQLTEALSASDTLRQKVKEALDLHTIATSLDKPLPFEEIAKLYYHLQSVWLKVDDAWMERLIDVSVRAINEGDTVEEMCRLGRIEFADNYLYND